MRRFVIEQSDADIVSHSGLALIGQALNKHSCLGKAVDNNVSLRHGIPHSDVLYSYMGLLCIGKSDCDAIENVRDDSLYSSALKIDTVPSAATVRQRMDTRANEFLPLVDRSCVDFLKSVGVKLTPLPMGHVPLDADITPMDNSRTKKQGVSRMYKGMDGYPPMMGYIGAEGYCVAVELRQGKQHCQKGTPDFLRRFLANANEITDKPMLFLPYQQIIDLYSDHGTSEQFHSEFKTDMDIERLPSGKFATNQLVLTRIAELVQANK